MCKGRRWKLGGSGLDYHRVRVDLNKLTVAIARHGLVVPVRIKLPIRYQIICGTSLGPSGPNEPGHSDQEEE